MLLILVRCLAPVLTHFDLESSVDIESFPDTFDSLRAVLCFHNQLLDTNCDRVSEPFWAEMWQPLMQFCQCAKRVLAQDPGDITAERAQQLARSQRMWVRVQAVLRDSEGWQAATDIFDRSEFDGKQSELVHLHKVLHWLAEHDIYGCAELAQEINLQGSHLTLRELQSHLRLVRQELQPLGSRLTLLEHFVDNESLFFNAAVGVQARDQPGNDMADAELWISEADRQIKALLANEIRLQDAKVFIDMTRQVSILDELAKITSYPGYATTTTELPATIQQALELVQYAVSAHVVADVAISFGLVPADDADIRYIERQAQHRPNRALKEAPQEYEMLARLFKCAEGSLQDIHFGLIAKFRECPCPSCHVRVAQSRM